MVSKTEVFEVNDDDKFEEEVFEVVENVFVLFGRGWWWSLNGDYGYG